MSEREWRLYVLDMIRCAEKIERYTTGYEQADFVENELAYDASIRNLELIGEAASRIPQAIRDSAANIPWRLIIATRNRLIHGYLGIDDDTLWSVIAEDIPALLANLRDLANRS